MTFDVRLNFFIFTNCENMKRTYFVHRCELPVISDTNLLGIPPYIPECNKWFHRLRKLTILDENMPQTKKFFRSYAAIRAEKQRHIRDFPMTIHPFSKCAIYRERILCVSWIVTYFIGPLKYCFYAFAGEEFWLLILHMILDVIFFINIIITAFTGYAIPLTKEIVLSRKAIFRSRVFTYLLPELLACLPYYYMTRLVQIDLKETTVVFLGAIEFVRIFRVRDCLFYLSNMFDSSQISESICTALLLFMCTIYMIFWCACGMFLVYTTVYSYNGLPENSFLRRIQQKDNVNTDNIEPFNSFENTFVILLTIAACHFYGAAEGYVEIILPIEKLLCSIIVIIGYLYCNYITAKLLVAFGSSNISETKYDELLYGVRQYARCRKLPRDIYKRMKVYYEYKYQKRFFKEETILATLPAHLQNEVILFSCRNILAKVHLFKGMPKGILGSILGYIKREIYLPNDVVIRYGEPLTKMYWVSFGTLAVYYGPNSVEILHFEDGDHFGDRCILKQSGTAVLTVVSLEISEIYTLSRKDIKHCKLFINEMTKRVLQDTYEKIELYKLLEEIMLDKGAQNRILADLRKGRILERDDFRENIS
ncbi:hypothetical protein WA026_009634 [Henosepilachna vigintioctopunctata]|uniref:Cyclic nucleotide-binding domain-containing protein n=1 Tax=Henosepilachna vigintioctopunctata TaxID=420089 RepID=A0AAW1TW90_9CUCU